MLMMTYDSKFREIPNKNNPLALEFFYFFHPELTWEFTIQNHVPGSFSIKNNFWGEIHLKKTNLLFFIATNSLLFKKKEMVTKAQTALSLHPSSGLSQRCQAISGAGSIRHLASWSIISDGLGWKKLGWFGSDKSFSFFEEGVWKKTCFLIENKMNERNQTVCTWRVNLDVFDIISFLATHLW